MNETQNLKTSNTVISVYLALVVSVLLFSTVGDDVAALWRSSSDAPVTERIRIGSIAAATEGASGSARDNTVNDTDNAARPISDVLQSDAGTEEGEVALNSNGDAPQNSAQAVNLGVDQFDFELTDNGAITGGRTAVSGELIEVRKPVMLRGEQLGSLAVFIDKNARLASDKATLASVLASDQASMKKLDRISDTGLITFQRLREFGINLRYDPIDDRIVLQDR